LKIQNVYTKYHVIKILNHKEFDKVNINVLIEKWMPCDALWVPRRKKGNIVLKQGEIKIILQKNMGKLC
jgi:hypothetical protein